MNAFLRLCLTEAPLAELLKAAAAAMQADAAHIEDADGAIRAQYGTLQYGAQVQPLIWQGAVFGKVYMACTAEIPCLMMQALAGRLALLQRRNFGTEVRLWQAIKQRHSAAAKVSALQKEFPSAPERTCVLLYMDTSALDDAGLSALYSETAALPAPATATAFDESGFAILYAYTKAAYKKLHAAAHLLLQRYDVTGALSQPFDGQRLANQLELLKLTIYAGKRLYPGQHLFRFEEFASFVFFLAAQRNLQLSRYYSEDVLQVIHHDYAHGTELARSLYAYLFYFMDLKAASQELRIHRNTVDYHIKKINQLLGGLPDTPQQFEMMCTYGMLAMVE